MKRTLTSLAQFVLPPFGLLVLVVAAWQAVTVAFDVPAYLAPRPAAVWESAWRHRAELVTAARLTATGAVLGFAGSLAAGTLVALVFSQSRLIQRAAWPYAIFLQTVPIIAIAPLLIKWFGTGMLGISSVAFIISLFPIIANGTTGLTAVDPNLLELFALHNASRLQTLVKMRLPNSIPYLVTGAKISCGLAVIGSIVGEIFAGSGTDQLGLGLLIQTTSGQLKTDYAFAALIVSALVGVALFGTVSLVGDWIVRRRGYHHSP